MTPGSKVGPYEIIALIGAGGMGEVYRARDTKLKREVALKVLPEAFATDPERMARFQREAEVLASLNHPNIAHIYGVEERALVMELVEGESPQGPLAFEEAWKIAAQIADALDYAHERGIVHRDLKPANVKVTADGVVKLLDFGLAKAFTGPASVSANPENSPTLTLGATQLGVILGTAGYMAPEQAKGKTVDKRADIWSFGVVLYELLMGERLFQGEDVSDTLAQVLTKEPDLTRATAQGRKLLGRCLEKDPKKRLRDIGEARYLIESGTDSPPQAGSLPHRVWPAAAGLFAAALAAVSFLHFREKPPVEEVVRFQIAPPDKQSFTSGAYLSPNGRWIAFPAQGPDGRIALWVRPLNSLDARLLAGTEGVHATIPPLWSPDSRFIAFAAIGKLKKVEVSGGPPQTVCEISGFWAGGAWTRTPSGEGIILFGTQGHALMRVSEAGGTPSPVTVLDTAHAELDHSGPVFLPDGRHFLYRRNSSDPGRRGIYLGSLDSQPAQQNQKRLIATSSFLAFAPASKGNTDVGYILFVRESSLMAQPFDSRRLELAGEAVPVAEGFAAAASSQFSVSARGVLAYRAGAGGGGQITRLTWYDRSGTPVGTLGGPGQYNTVALSRDGNRAAFMLTDPHAAGPGGTTGNADIWVQDVARGIPTRLTFDAFTDAMAVWSPDATRIAFTSNRDGLFNLYWKLSSGAGPVEALLKSGEQRFAYDWSLDGRFVLYGQTGPKGYDLWFLPLAENNRKPTSYLATDSNESQARFSPDGRYVAYTSDASGKNEVYVRPFPDASSGLWQISTSGGNQPHWRRDGRELFYISADSKVMAVPVRLSPVFQKDAPKTLFAAPIWGGASNSNVTRWDVTGDGKKFLITTVQSDAETAPPSPVTVVLNWQKDLRK